MMMTRRSLHAVISNCEIERMKMTISLNVSTDCGFRFRQAVEIRGLKERPFKHVKLAITISVKVSPTAVGKVVSAMFLIMFYIILPSMLPRLCRKVLSLEDSLSSSSSSYMSISSVESNFTALRLTISWLRIEGFVSLVAD